jgi:hypothetical protein
VTLGEPQTCLINPSTCISVEGFLKPPFGFFQVGRVGGFRHGELGAHAKITNFWENTLIICLPYAKRDDDRPCQTKDHHFDQMSPSHFSRLPSSLSFYDQEQDREMAAENF